MIQSCYSTGLHIVTMALKNTITQAITEAGAPSEKFFLQPVKHEAFAEKLGKTALP
jgi:hypothetical protein